MLHKGYGFYGLGPGLISAIHPPGITHPTVIAGKLATS
jgi:hypothetical protein